MQTFAENQADRRRHPRIPTCVNAVVVLRNERILHCTIRNYCAGGLYLEWSGPAEVDAGSLEQGMQLRVRFQIPQGDDKIQHDVHVRVAHVFRTGVGCAFVQDESAAVQALSSFTARKERQSAPGDAAAAPRNPERGEIVEALRQQVHHFHNGHFPGFYLKLKDVLLSAANNARSNQEQGFYFEAMANLDAQFDPLRDSCIQGVYEAFDELLQPAPKNEIEVQLADFSTDDLTLVEDESFEEWVLVSGMISAAEGRYSETLFDLNQRLRTLFQCPVENDNNPLGPSIFCWNFKDALSRLGLNLVAKRLVYQTLGETLLRDLGDLIAEGNHILENHGIESKPRTVQPAPARPQASSPAADVEQAPEATSGRPGSGFGEIPAPAGTLHHATAPLAPVPVSPQQIMDLLPKVRDYTPGNLQEPLSRILAEQTGDGQQRVPLESQARQAVEFTDSLVRSFLEDEKIPLPLRKSLARLEVPLLRTALKEPAFLNDPGHPATRAINTLEQLSLRLRNARRTPEQYRLVDDLVQELMHEVEQGKEIDSDTLFENLVERLEPAYEWQEKHFQAAVRRLVESCKGEDRLYRAKKAVADELATLLEGRKIPVVVANLLSLGWASLLVLTELRGENHSKERQAYRNAFEYIIEWFGPDCSAPPRNRDAIKKVLGVIVSGLSKAPVNPVKTKRTLKILTHALLGDLQLFRLVREKRILLQADKIHNIVQFVPRPTLRDLDRRRFARHIQEIKDLRAGNWVVEHPPHEESRPHMLAWRSEDLSRFVFVDGSGAKSHDLNLTELAERLAEGTLRTLEDGELPLLDRSVSNVLAKKYNETSSRLTEDFVTGLLNRRAFEERLKEAVESSWAQQSTHALLLLNLDQFNLVTETCGHDAADRLLQEVANIILAYAPEGHVTGHLGLGQFAMLLPDLGEKEGRKIAEKQRVAIDNYVFSWEAQRFDVSASIGIALIQEESEDGPTCMHQATMAALTARENGGNRIRLYDPEDMEIEHQRLLMSSAGKIDEILEEEKIVLFLQAINPIDPESGLEPHYEVLMRIQDQDGRLTSPVEFIEAAEYYKRMKRVDRWVVDTLFDWLETYHDLEPQLGGFSINLSGQSIGDPEMLDFIIARLRKTRFPLRKIAFEITETAGIANEGNARDFVEAIKKEGCQFYLDDFGTGLSSYSYLKSYPVDCIKIDGSFIRHILEDETDQAMVRSITEIGHFMNKHVIAEFVENDEVIALLKEIGVDYVQGWGVGKPMPLSELENSEAGKEK